MLNSQWPELGDSCFMLKSTSFESMVYRPQALSFPDIPTSSHNAIESALRSI
jgi:hypothetical protein